MNILILIAALSASPFSDLADHVAASGRIIADKLSCRPAENPSGVLPAIPSPPNHAASGEASSRPCAIAAQPHETDRIALGVAPYLCTAGTADVDPLQALTQAVVDTDALVKSASVALADALPKQAAAHKAFTDELTRRGILLPTPVDPTPIVPTPVGPVTSIVVVTSPQSCPPCAQLAPVLAGLQSSIPITAIDAGSPGAAQWKAVAIPTIVMLVNGKEVSRSVGFLDAAALTDWYQKTAAWAVVKFPPPKVSDEVPQPPRR